jgi:hypothetical protein
VSTLITWKQFTEIVDRSFSFLVKDYGFEPPLNKEPVITYKSPYVQVEIFHDLNGRWDLEVSINSVQDAPYGDFHFDTIGFEKMHRQDWATVLARFPSNKIEYLESLLHEESRRLKKYCSEILKGNCEDIYRLKLLSQEFKERFTVEYQNLNRQKSYAVKVTDLMNQIIREQHWHSTTKG